METDLIDMTTGTWVTSTKDEHCDCSKVHRTLGLHPAPTGCQLKKAQELQIKNDQFAADMAKTPLSRNEESRPAYWMMRLPSMAYCPPCTYMTKKQLHLVQKKMTTTSISKRVYSSKVPRAVASDLDGSLELAIATVTMSKALEILCTFSSISDQTPSLVVPSSKSDSTERSSMQAFHS